MEWNSRGGIGEQFWDLGYIWCQSWHNLPDGLPRRSVALISLLEIYSKVIIMDLHKDTIIRAFMIGNGKMLEITCTSQTSDLIKKKLWKVLEWYKSKISRYLVLDSGTFQSFFFPFLNALPFSPFISSSFSYWDMWKWELPYGKSQVVFKERKFIIKEIAYIVIIWVYIH